MSDDRIGRAVAVEFADARTDDQAHGQRSEPAHRVHDTGAGEVGVAFAQPEVGA